MNYVTMRQLIKRRHVAIALTILLGALPLVEGKASAQNECAANFQVTGDPRNGASYVTYITIPHIDIHSALGQVEKIAIDSNLVPDAENYEGDEGTLTISRKGKSGFLHESKGFPMMIKANKTNDRLIMAVQLNQGQTSTAENMQGFMCTILTHVTMDSAGAAAAAAAHAQTHSDEITNITATELAQKLTRRAWGLAFKPDDLQNEYMGRVYRIDGKVLVTMTPGEALARAQSIQNGHNSFDISYDTSKVKTGLLGHQAFSQLGNVTCHTDPKQMPRFMALRNGDYATLIGKVVQVTATRNAADIILDCSFEK